MLLHFLTEEWTGDSRVKGMFLMSNPYPTIVCSLLYFYAVKTGINLMRHRRPFELRSCLIVYNCVLVGLSTWIFMDGGRFGWFGHYNIACAECDPTDSPVNRGMVNISYIFYLSKFVEMMDTMFFILRKKNHLLTSLHLIHHGMLPVSCWFTVKYLPVGHATFMGFINSLVHMVMYCYYAMAAAGCNGALFAHLKKSITKLQMVQFVLMILHSTQTLFNGCQIPKWVAYSNAAHGLLFLTLFADFYRSRYNSKVVPKKIECQKEAQFLNPHSHGA